VGDATKVRVGADGVVYHAPLGTTLPTTAVEVLDAAFKDVGTISDDAVNQVLSNSTNDIKSWAGSIVRKVQTESGFDLKFMMIETNDESLLAYYGAGNYSAGHISVKNKLPDPESWVIDVLDGDNRVRVVVENGQVTDRGDIPYKNGDSIGYDVTVSSYPGSDTFADIYLDGPDV
jgi:hypothetical protein